MDIGSITSVFQNVTAIDYGFIGLFTAIAVGGVFAYKHHNAVANASTTPAVDPAPTIPAFVPTFTVVPEPIAPLQAVVPVQVDLPSLVPASLPKPVWPRLLLRGHVFYRAVADLNKKFTPPSKAGIVNGSYVGIEGCVMFDPSNAPSGMSSRSPNGYPLVYSFGADGSVVGAPVVQDGDEHFNSDSEIAPFWEGAIALNAQLKAIIDSLQIARQAIIYTGPIPASTLSPSEQGWCYNQVLASDAGVKRVALLLSGSDEEIRNVLIAGQGNANFPGVDTASPRIASAIATYNL